MSEIDLAREWGTERIRTLAAELLSTWVASQATAKSQSQYSVAECLPVFRVQVEEIYRADPDQLVDSLEWGARWHLQILKDELPVGTVRVQETPSGVKIRSWSRGSLAGKINMALVEADVRLPNDSHFLVMVEAKPLAFSALLFVPREQGEPWIFPVQVPVLLRSLEGKFVDAKDLLRRIKGIRPIQAVSRDHP